MSEGGAGDVVPAASYDGAVADDGSGYTLLRVGVGVAVVDGEDVGDQRFDA
ncbi:hypothetical protein AB0L64_09700 [Kribbella sp. NPDC051936]|uniref:hypothetical protein n=1 Tax=Kribbella sp. NPDC051936 TaxID=3154946 RepID=UPI00342FD82F